MQLTNFKTTNLKEHGNVSWSFRFPKIHLLCTIFILYSMQFYFYSVQFISLKSKHISIKRLLANVNCLICHCSAGFSQHGQYHLNQKYKWNLISTSVIKKSLETNILRWRKKIFKNIVKMFTLTFQNYSFLLYENCKVFFQQLIIIVTNCFGFGTIKNRCLQQGS